MKNCKIISLLFTALCLVLWCNAQGNKQIRQMITADSARLSSIYIDLHQNPELGFMEVRTAGIIAGELKALGFQLITGIAKTGLAGIMKNGNGPVVMYRADMDCNSVKETTGLSYASTKMMKKEDGTETPVMHACGHDAHVTWMLGVAKIMVALKNNWKGTLVIVAQPAEEMLTGAQAMVNDSMYAKGVPVPDYLFGMHTWSGMVLGTIENGPGFRFAGSDQLDVTFHGMGGHGSAPENTKDPVVMACNAVLQYQTIISRNIPALEAAVLTVGSIQTGTDNNVIPASALVKLNLRWFDEEMRNTLLDGIKRINEGIAIANGLTKDQYPTIKMKGYAVPLDNDEALSEKVNLAIGNAFSTRLRILTEVPPVMGTEDFQHLVYGNKKTVYDFIKVGVTNPEIYQQFTAEGKAVPHFHHTGAYRIDLAAIPLGTEIGTVALMELFRK